MRIPYTNMQDTFEKVLVRYGFGGDRARLCATLFADASRDGVASHGLNRFPVFVEMIRKGHVKVDHAPALVATFGMMERWDGMLGPGPVNAYHGMARAIALAHQHGMGCVAMKNTNHWMRGGNFGWQAVEAGCIGICFTNTTPNMPAWGGSEAVLGNNPLVIAVPRKDGPLVLDMAMSQFSYGKISTYIDKNEQLPYAGGFDKEGNLTRDPETIAETGLALPIGFWKGAGLSLMLDVVASILSDGNATHTIGEQQDEYAVSQVFICFDPARLGSEGYIDDKVNDIIADLKASGTFGNAPVRYPGEHTLAIRRENLDKGVPVNAEIWKQVVEMAGQKDNFSK